MGGSKPKAHRRARSLSLSKTSASPDDNSHNSQRERSSVKTGRRTKAGRHRSGDKDFLVENRLLAAANGKAAKLKAERDLVEKKKMKDKRREQRWLDALRPGLNEPGRYGDFVLDPSIDDEDVKKQTRFNVTRANWKEAREEKLKKQAERQQLEQKWLAGLRPPLRAKDKPKTRAGQPIPDWDNSTEPPPREPTPRLGDTDTSDED